LSSGWREIFSRQRFTQRKLKRKEGEVMGRKLFTMIAVILSVLAFIDSDELEDYFEDVLWYQGYDVGLTVTKNIFKGKESKTGDAIRGKWNLKMDAYFFDYGLRGKISVVTTFTGSRGVFYSEGKKALPSTKPVSRIVLDALREWFSR